MLWKDIFNFMAGRSPSFLTLLHALWMIHSIEVYFYEVASDRWMDDVCRVCPLCRGNVCEPKAVDTGVETALETWSTLITVWILPILYKKHYTCFLPLQFLVFVSFVHSLSVPWHAEVVNNKCLNTLCICFLMSEPQWLESDERVNTIFQICMRRETSGECKYKLTILNYCFLYVLCWCLNCWWEGTN
jgi:hypothetical protein